MCWKVCITMLVCLLTELWTVPALAADGGHITFSGAVIAPTCVHEAKTNPRSRWRRCFRPDDSRRRHSTAFATSAVALTHAQMAGFRSLSWMRRHGELDSQASVTVQTRTYR